MPTIDLVSQVCIFVDYPLWRTWVGKYRSKFNKVILYASRHHGVTDLEDFWRKELPETWVSTEIDWTKPGVDWRQEETLPLLEKSDAEWILFMEADFFCDDWDKLWLDVEKTMETSDAIGLWNETHFPYLHPCFFLVRREALDKTKKDFRAHPEINGGDHFAMITHDLIENGAKITKLQDLGWTDPEHAMHLGGLTYPYQNFKGDETIIGVKYPEALFTYNRKLASGGWDTDPEFLELAKKLAEVLYRKIPGLYETWPVVVPRWEKFFK